MALPMAFKSCSACFKAAPVATDKIHKLTRFYLRAGAHDRSFE
jgi:hypothetical protein